MSKISRPALCLESLTTAETAIDMSTVHGFKCLPKCGYSTGQLVGTSYNTHIVYTMFVCRCLCLSPSMWRWGHESATVCL